MEYLLAMLIAGVMLCTIGNFSACKVTNPEVHAHQYKCLTAPNVMDVDCC